MAAGVRRRPPPAAAEAVFELVVPVVTCGPTPSSPVALPSMRVRDSSYPWCRDGHGAGTNPCVPRERNHFCQGASFSTPCDRDTAATRLTAPGRVAAPPVLPTVPHVVCR